MAGGIGRVLVVLFLVFLRPSGSLRAFRGASIRPRFRCPRRLIGQVQGTAVAAGGNDGQCDDGRGAQARRKAGSVVGQDQALRAFTGIQTATLYAMNSIVTAAAKQRPEAATPTLETVEVETGPNATAAVIWLHGLGADGHDFEPIVPELKWSGMPDIRYVFPHAPVRPVTINGGIPMRAWYDIVSLTSARGHDRQGIVDSVNQAAELLRREIGRGVPSRRIILAGFSQGGAIALQLALRFPEPLAGVAALSSYLLFPDRLAEQRHEANRQLPAFVAHGSADPVVPPQLGEDAATALKNLGHPVECHTYPMVHSVCPQEILDLRSWMQKRLE